MSLDHCRQSFGTFSEVDCVLLQRVVRRARLHYQILELPKKEMEGLKKSFSKKSWMSRNAVGLYFRDTVNVCVTEATVEMRYCTWTEKQPAF